MNESKKNSAPMDLLAWWVVMGSLSFVTTWMVFGMMMLGPEGRNSFMSDPWHVATGGWLLGAGFTVLLTLWMTLGSAVGEVYISNGMFPNPKRYWYLPFLAMIAPVVVVAGIVVLIALIARQTVRGRQAVIV